jgi:hypothetical protein
MFVVRTRGSWCACAALSITVLSAQPAAGQDPQQDPMQGVPISATTLASVIEGLQLPVFEPSPRVIEKARRPAALVPLYASLSVLQGLDIHSTTSALSTGQHHEANPIMSSIVGNRGAFVAVKVASTATIIALSERMWKKHRVGAVVFAIAANSAMAVVVANNYQNTRK